MAVTFDFGKCASCGESNSKTLQNCRKCSATLPWAKTATAKSDVAISKPKIGLGDIAFGAMAVQILGGLIVVGGAFLWCGNVFGFYRTFPGVGYLTMALGGAVWRGGLAMD